MAHPGRKGNMPEAKVRKARKATEHLLCVVREEADAPAGYVLVPTPASYVKASAAWAAAKHDKLTGRIRVVTNLGEKSAVVKVEERYELK